MANMKDGTRYTYNKVSRTTRQSNDTLTVDPDFTHPVKAGETWTFHLLLRVTTTAAADFKFTIGAPSGSVGWAVAERIAVGGRTLIDFQTTGFAFTDASAADESVYEITGVMRVIADGTLALRWAQNTSAAVDTYVHAGSFMELAQLSS
jgi:hypothetical protein